MSALRAILALGAAACALAAGCALMTPVRVENRAAVISDAPADVPRAAVRAGTMLVLEPRAIPLYDTPRIAYAVRPHEIAYFARTEWARTPSRMLQPLLVQALRATGAFAAVEVSPYAGHVTYALHTEIRELRQDFITHAPTLRLVMHVRLSDEEQGTTLLDRDLAVAEPMRERSPQAGVEAANRATAAALTEMATHVVAALDRARAATGASAAGCRRAG